MRIPFTKAQAAGNDFLIVKWENLSEAELSENSLGDLARRICDRRYGIGADGMEVLFFPKSDETDAFIRVFNSDGGEAEISGNGTRCVAAQLVALGLARDPLRIATKAGVKQLRLMEHSGQNYIFDMAMGRPRYSKDEVGCTLETAQGPQNVVIVNVGNPQCVVFVDDFDFDWRAAGREIEAHPRFPNRTNVSFVKALDRGALEVRFWERGAGETLSSGTGATGAGAAAILTGKAESPLQVKTPAGDLKLWWHDKKGITLRGPAQIIARGEYFLPVK